jgi:hypothetical protein
MYLNKVELIGFLGRDAETKTTPNRKAVTTFSIATKTSYIKDGHRREGTEWHRIQAWGRLGNTPPPSRRARISASKANCAAANTIATAQRSAPTTSLPTRSLTFAPASATWPGRPILPRPPHTSLPARRRGRPPFNKGAVSPSATAERPLAVARPIDLTYPPLLGFPERALRIRDRAA